MTGLPKSLTLGLALSLASHAAPASAQEENSAWRVTETSPLMKDFILTAPKPDITLSITGELKEDRQDVTLRIGERRLNNFERERYSLTQDMGDMGEAKLKFMKIEWRLRFGGPR